MPNRDHEDSRYNRYEGRFESQDDQNFRDESNRGSYGWERRGPDVQSYRSEPFRSEPFRNEPFRNEPFRNEPFRNDRGEPFPSAQAGSFRNYGEPDYRREARFGSEQDRGFGQRSYAQQHRGSDASQWFDERRDAQRLRPHDRSQSFGSTFYDNQNWNHQQGDSRRADYSRVQSNYGARDLGQTQRFDRPQSFGQGYAHEQRGHDESWGEQIRHAGQQFASKVKRAFRGPKGYKRSDDRIREDVNDRLAQQDHFDPSDLEVSVQNAEVTLTGTVQSRHDKFLAEEIADDVSGVTEVHNQLRVRRDQIAPAATTLTGTGSTSTSPNTDASRNRNARA